LVAKIATNYYELIALDNKLDILNKTIEKQKEALFVVKMLKF
jgi:outer membrane protein TolC